MLTLNELMTGLDATGHDMPEDEILSFKPSRVGYTIMFLEVKNEDGSPYAVSVFSLDVGDSVLTCLHKEASIDFQDAIEIYNGVEWS